MGGFLGGGGGERDQMPGSFSSNCETFRQYRYTTKHSVHKEIDAHKMLNNEGE